MEKAPAEDEHIRQAILLGLRLGDDGAEDVNRLLAYWTGDQPGPATGDWRDIMGGWQQWWNDEHPDKPAANLPATDERPTWEPGELRAFLASADGQAGDAARGKAVFIKADCAKCHRYGDHGEALGPELTTVARRFSTKEVLESILFPSQVISDQYAARNIVTADGRSFTGLLVPGGQNEMVLLQSNGEKIVIAKDDIEANTRSRISAMPKGLLDHLTLQEISDLFAYLGAKGNRMAEQPNDTPNSSRRRR